MVLQRITGSLERFADFEKLFKTNQAVQRAIGALYTDLIDFCTRVVRFYSRSSLRIPPSPSRSSHHGLTAWRCCHGLF